MRCFFNLVGPHDSLVDTDGVEVSSTEALGAQVAKAIEEVRRADPGAARDWKGWRLEVTDSSGAVLLSVNLDRFPPSLSMALPLGTLLLLQSCELCEDLVNVLPDLLVV